MIRRYAVMPLCHAVMMRMVVRNKSRNDWVVFRFVAYHITAQQRIIW